MWWLLTAWTLACGPGETWSVTTLSSDTILDDYCIYVHVPQDCQDGGCQSLYYLDADWNTGLFRDLLPKQADLAPIVSVGIGYPNPDALNRNRDYLTPYDDREPLSGGGEAFYDFLASELVPWVEARWPIDPTQPRVLFGHSYGGYFAAWVLFHEAAADRPVFPHVLSASPTLGWADDYLLAVEEAQATLGTAQAPRALYLAVGSHEDEQMLLSYGAMAEQLAARDDIHFSSHTTQYAGAGHEDTSALVLVDGLTRWAE
jgi:predicted alpha/beta superfamily hydrolase